MNWDSVRKAPDLKFPETSERDRQADMKYIEAVRALRGMLDFLSEQDLTNWDRKFVRSIENYVERLTPKQLNILNNMYQKYKGEISWTGKQIN